MHTNQAAGELTSQHLPLRDNSAEFNSLSTPSKMNGSIRRALFTVSIICKNEERYRERSDLKMRGENWKRFIMRGF
jgi:hypothetical protein